MEKCASLVKFAKRKGGLDVYIGIIGAMMAPDSTGDEKCYLTVTLSLYVSLGSDFTD